MLADRFVDNRPDDGALSNAFCAIQLPRITFKAIYYGLSRRFTPAAAGFPQLPRNHQGALAAHRGRILSGHAKFLTLAEATPRPDAERQAPG